LQRVTLDLEPQIDAFTDGIQRISQYRIAAERVADRILGVTAERLEKRDQAAQKAGGTAGIGPREVLSALSHVVNQQQGR
jgi:kinetochore protein Mis13/DSN1